MIRTYDEELINSIVETMIDDVVEDETYIDSFDLDVNRDCWLMADEKALFHVTAFNRTTLEIHCYVPKSMRIKSKIYGKQALRWIKDNGPEMYSKVITKAPSFYRHIRVYLLGLGFKQEGNLTNAFTKHGEKWDLIYYGLNRCDI